ncbi:relaxase/mobilization nuclease domain-containing protein [Flavobacterium psychrophilum]|nr:relaxase/mobilization nuclease domain-containing protein [Flavobacterium psychrophilum]
MVGLAKACSGGGALGNYICDERKGYELDRNNLCGETPKEMIEEMKMIQDLNKRATNKTFSLVLSPDIKDGKNLSDEQLKAMTQEYLTKLGIDPEKQQYVAFVHTEKEHKHIHIIANRVEPSGKLISDHHIGKQAQFIAHCIAKERGLISARDKMYQNINKQNSHLKEIKTEIFKKHQTVLKNNPGTFSKYKDEMKKLGLEVKPTINKQGEIQGFRIIDTETKNDFKASEINRSMSVGNLIKSGLKNDLNNQLNSPLKTTAKKQNLGLEHQLKRTINSKSKSKNFGKEKGKFTLGKEKLTLKQRIEYSKIEDMMVDNINIKHQEYHNEQPFEELKQQLENKNLNKDNER